VTWQRLLFTNPDLPVDNEAGYLGIAFVEGDDVVEAARNAHRTGCNPGGQVQSDRMAGEPPIEWRNVLMSKSEFVEAGLLDVAVDSRALGAHDERGAIVRACLTCATTEEWDLIRPLWESEAATNSRSMIVHAHHADEFRALGYEVIAGRSIDPGDSGLLIICPHLLAEIDAEIEAQDSDATRGMNGAEVRVWPSGTHCPMTRHRRSRPSLGNSG
jgi:hypothetical protein